MSNVATVTKPSALDLLKGLTKKAPASAPVPGVSNNFTDPAIAGARRDKNTVKLGYDPKITHIAAQTAGLRAALDRAEAEFTIVQGTMRDYGKEKRGLYNDAYKCEVTTACVPYEVDTPQGKETKYVQVVCTNKYSVQADMILGNKSVFGDSYERLFVEETKKTLKPNAEELIRGIFEQVGLSGEDLEAAMTQLLEKTTTVKTRENFEQEAKKVPSEVQAILAQAVTRSQPALKFPG